MTAHRTTIVTVLGVMLGIVIGEQSMFASEIALGALLLGVVQIALYFFERKNIGQIKSTQGILDTLRAFSVSLTTFLFCLGISAGILRMELVEEKGVYMCETSCTFSAKIISSPEVKKEYQVFTVKVFSDSQEMYNVQVRTTLYPRFHIGETLELKGKVSVPDKIFSHDNEVLAKKTFDYASYLRTKNIGSETFYPHITVTDTQAHTLTDILGRWKENFVDRIGTYVSPPASSLAEGMLFGATSMSEELLQQFRVAGLSHIIVLSGFNIVIVIIAVLFIFSFLPLILRVTFASIFVILFVMMVGGSASVLRATLMAFISLLAMVSGRKYVAKQALVLSLLCIILYEPYALMHDVSLHLSFLATAGLVYMSDTIRFSIVKYFPSIYPSFLELITTTLSAYFATLPYVMFTFGTVSMYALIANIIIVPLVPCAMLLTFFVTLFSYISESAAYLFGFIDTLFINCILFITNVIEWLPLSQVLLSLSFFGMLFFYASGFVIIFLMLPTHDETLPTTEDRNLTDIISY